jgi:4-amino-4-deoxy-L-arabinose transferase-like glycosyltransferase
MPRSAARLPRVALLRLGGALVSVAVAVALFTRFGINSTLSRDESIYTYGSQQLSHGVAPYVGIFDPKGPMPTWLGGLAAAVADGLGRNDIYAIRLVYFLCACLTVLAVYLLAARLWRSTLAGLVAAVTFASFRWFAADALSGPDAKTPGILLAVLCMWLLTRRAWFWGAFAGSLAFLVWQPLALYAVVAAGVAVLNADPGRRWRALVAAVAGAVSPLLLTGVYFAAAGAFDEFVEAVVVFPFRGVARAQETVSARLERIAAVVNDGYGVSGTLFWVGSVALLVVVVLHLLRGRRRPLEALRDPLVSVVLATGVLQAAYAASDFQGYPDLYPLLPYPALGLAGAVAVLLTLARPAAARLVVTTAALVALAVLTAFSWSWFNDDPLHDGGLRAQRANACAVDRLLGPSGSLYALGDPSALVMTHRRNPDRFIYLGSGVDRWKIAHQPGGFAAWTEQVRAADPAVVVLRGWSSPVRRSMATFLRDEGFRPAYVGRWRVFLPPPTFEAAERRGVTLTQSPTDQAEGVPGRPIRPFGCA